LLPKPGTPGVCRQPSQVRRKVMGIIGLLVTIILIIILLRLL
jgi:hypothetical protein